MLMRSYPLNQSLKDQSLKDSQSPKDGFRELLKAFWKFSLFYGEYHATPLDKRQLMLEEYQHRHNRSS